MIKINLGKTRIQDGEGLESAYGHQAEAGGQSPIVQILVKLLVISIGVIALNFYEKSNLESLGQQIGQLSQERSRLEVLLNQKNEELSGLGTIQEDSKTLNDKMKLLKELSQLRLREVKSLDYLQTITPPRLWLTSLGINKDRYIFRGRARESSAVSAFVGKLEDGGYFSDVVLVKDSEMTSERFNVRDFEVVARSEVVN